MQEFRLYANPISESIFDFHVQSPLTIISRGITSSYDDLLVRWPLGADLAQYNASHSNTIPGIQPNQVSKFSGPAGSSLPTSGYFYGFKASIYNSAVSDGYSQEEERYYTVMPLSLIHI